MAGLLGMVASAHAEGPLPYAGPLRPVGPPIVRPMGPPFVRPFGAPFFRPFGRPFFRPFGPPRPLAVGPPIRPGQRLFEAPRSRTCFSPAETRDIVVARGLTEPFRAMRMGGVQGEALRARLCRWKQDELVYEVAVLRRDGRIVHVYMNARNGQNVDPPGGGDERK